MVRRGAPVRFSIAGASLFRACLVEQRPKVAKSLRSAPAGGPKERRKQPDISYLLQEPAGTRSHSGLEEHAHDLGRPHSGPAQPLRALRRSEPYSLVTAGYHSQTHHGANPAVSICRPSPALAL